jgi:hypothetical protein
MRPTGNVLVLAGALAISAPAASLAAPVFYFDEASYDTAIAGLGLTGSVTEDFESFAPDFAAASIATPSGITFATSTPDVVLRIDDAAGTSSQTTSGTKALAQLFDNTFDEQLGFGTQVDVTLPQPVQAVSMQLIFDFQWDYLETDFQITVNGQSQFITTTPGIPLPNEFDESRFVGVVDSAQSFNSLQMVFDTTSSNSVAVLDDFAFEVIPLPAPILLLGGALLGLGALRLRRRA